MGYCSDCFIFINCPWCCSNCDIKTEEPIEDCLTREDIGDTFILIQNS